MEVTCPSGLRGNIRKAKVRDIDDLHSAPSGGNNVAAYCKLLQACWQQTLDKGPYRWDGEPDVIPWNQVVSGDLFYMLIALRRALHGGDYDYRVTCKECNAKPFKWRVNLDKDLDERPMSDEVKEVLSRPEKDRLFKAELKDGSELVFKPGVAALEGRIDPNERPLIRAVLPRILTLAGEAQQKKLREVLLDMDADIFDDLRAKLLDVECGIDTDILVRCPSCNATQVSSLPFGRKYFFPRSTR